MQFKQLIITLILLGIFNIYGQNTDNPDLSRDQIQKELDLLRKDVNDLKAKNSWFDFKVEGSTRTVFGMSLWAQDNYTIKATASQSPVTVGFDIENNLRFSMNLDNKIIASSSSKTTDGTEISIKVKFQSLGASKLQPRGSWYKLDATDDQGRPVQVYLPRIDSNASNIMLGNLQLIFDEAKVKNIMGIGLFLNYKDIQEIHHYYGVTPMLEILKLNHLYFNNGFSTDLFYYSFDSKSYNPSSDYDPVNEVSYAVKLWNDNMLFTNPSGSSYDQRPHGFSLGYDGSLSKHVSLLIEGGGSSKDAFDPKYFEDNQIDAGFFVNGGVRFFDKSFSFYPKAALSFAFQTDVSDDQTVVLDTAPGQGDSTFAAAVQIPLDLKLKSGNNDKIHLELNWNINTHLAWKSFATIIGVNTEFILLDEKLKLSLPVVYSAKTNQGGFIRSGNENVKWLDQDYEDQVINSAFIFQFNTKNLLDELFSMTLTNQLHFNMNAIWDESNQFDPEIFFYEIFRHDFQFTDIGVNRVNWFYEIGYGLAYHARLVSSNIYYDSISESWKDSVNHTPVTIDQSNRFEIANVLSVQTGLIIDIFKNLSFGIQLESPKLLIGGDPIIGDQKSYGTFKLWSEIKL